MAESQIEYNYSALARTARQAERYAHTCRAVLSSQRIPHREVIIRDASEFGLGGRGAMLVPGEHLRVFAEKIGDFEAVVKWARGDSFGLQVDRPVDLTLFVTPQSGPPIGTEYRRSFDLNQLYWL